MERLRGEREQLALARHEMIAHQQRLDCTRQQIDAKADETAACRRAELDEATSRMDREREDLARRQQRLAEREQEFDRRNAELVSADRQLEAANTDLVRRIDEAEATAAAFVRQLDAATVQLEGRTRELQEVRNRERTLADRVAELEASERAALTEAGLMRQALGDLRREASAPVAEPDLDRCDGPDPHLAALEAELLKLEVALHNEDETARPDRHEPTHAVRDRRNLIWAAIVACTAMTCLLLFWLAANS
jgi:chromosome segregation ATPase